MVIWHCALNLSCRAPEGFKIYSKPTGPSQNPTLTRIPYHAPRPHGDTHTHTHAQSVIQWFADRADLIIIMFDAHKLDISDELRVVMDALRIHQDKIRILLNKADQIDSQQLMRIYGVRVVLLWFLWDRTL